MVSNPRTTKRIGDKTMTRKEAKRRAELYSILAEGKTIQVQNSDGTWEDIKIETLNHLYEYYKYRIKQEPKYRPFKNKEECWQEMLNHKPFAWVKEKYSDRYNLITEVNGLSIKVKEACLFTDGVKYYTFADGTPFGIKEE